MSRTAFLAAIRAPDGSLLRFIDVSNLPCPDCGWWNAVCRCGTGHAVIANIESNHIITNGEDA